LVEWPWSNIKHEDIYTNDYSTPDKVYRTASGGVGIVNKYIKKNKPKKVLTLKERLDFSAT